MRFWVLGPLSVSDDSGPFSLGGRKQRSLLAVLLLHANQVVSRDLMIDAVWGERSPASASESLDSYVYRLRKLLGRDRLPRRDGGYLLRVEPGELDAERFEQLTAEATLAAQAGDHEAAIERFTRAFALWRGPAWSDLVDDPAAVGEGRRLDELRLSALESRVEAGLASGAGGELVAELEQLVTEHPLRERLVAALMLALYRAGRQTDALELFQITRRRLVDELGLEPRPELHALQRRILQHDPTLAAPRPAVLRSAPRDRWQLAVIVAVALIVVVVGVFVLGAGAANRRPVLAAGANGVIAVGPGAARVAVATPLPGAPSAACTGAASVWLVDANGGTVTRIDPASGEVTDRISVGGDPASIACGTGVVWVADSVGATVLRIDPTTETVTQTIRLGGGNPDAITLGAGKVWVTDSSTEALYELDPSTGTVLRTIPLDVRPSAIAFGDGALWITGYDNSEVVKLEPSSGRVEGRVRVGTGPGALTFADGDLWVANTLDSTVSRIDPATLRALATIAVGSAPTALVANAGSVWVANQYSETVARISPARDAVVATATTGGIPVTLTPAAGRLWVGVDATATGHRGGTLRVAASRFISSTDPAFFSSAEPAQFGGLAYDTLVTFDHTGGADGLRLVPDLALTLPAPVDGGRTYTFHLRPGIRYSNGLPLRASDFLRSFERLFTAGSPGTDFFTDIVGAPECSAKPTGCDLSRGIVADDRAGTITFHLAAPDPEFLDQLTEQDYAAPMPPGTTDRDAGLKPIPGTGPYRIVRADHTGIYLDRNPYFREWSHAAQPAGDPDQIVWRYWPSLEAAASAVADGRADWLYGSIPTDDYKRISIQSPAQLHSNPQFAVEFLPLNTHRAPFDRLLARRALNYAIDRNLVQRLYGGPAFATPTCEPFAPGLPGYRAYCPYTSQPTVAGSYGGPDLAFARRLVAQSHTRGDHVTVLGVPDEGFVPPSETAYVASVLRSLGYHVTVLIRPFASITNATESRVPLNTSGDWLTDYPDPSSYIPPFFSCGGGNNPGYVCNHRLDDEMRRAELLELRSSAAADALWASIDRTLTDEAYWVPTENTREVDLVSRRLGNYEFNPVWGFLTDQSWVR